MDYEKQQNNPACGEKCPSAQSVEAEHFTKEDRVVAMSEIRGLWKQQNNLASMH